MRCRGLLGGLTLAGLLVLFTAAAVPAADVDKGFNEPVGQGLDFTPPEKYKSFEKSIFHFKGVMPPSQDLSAKMPPVRNQGVQSSCVAWSTSYYLRSYQQARQRGWVPTDDAKIFSPSYVYNQVRRGECRRGMTIPAALNILQLQGVLPLAEFPYDAESCHLVPNMDQVRRAAQNRIGQWSRVDYTSIYEVKSQLAGGNPIVVGCATDANFKRFRGPGVFRDWDPNTVQGGHAMLVVGYDDGRQAVRLINSWGERWGDNGYGWVDYETFKRMCREAYVAEDSAPAPLPGPGPQPTWAPPTTMPPVPGPQPTWAPPTTLSPMTTTTYPVPPVTIAPPRPDDPWAKLYAHLEALSKKAAYRVRLSTNKTRFKVGDTLEITCQAPNDGYLNVMALAPGADRVTVLFPNRFHPESQVKKGDVIGVPAKGDGFVLRAHPPAGNSLIVVFHTAKPLNAFSSDPGEAKGTFKTFTPKSLRGFGVEELEGAEAFGAGKIVTYIEE